MSQNGGGPKTVPTSRIEEPFEDRVGCCGLNLLRDDCPNQGVEAISVQLQRKRPNLLDHRFHDGVFSPQVSVRCSNILGRK